MRQGIQIDTSPPIPALPILKDKTKIDVRYALVSPYTTAHIYWDAKESELKYEVEEPILNPQEKMVLDQIEDGMREIINVNVVVEKTQEAVLEYIDKTARLLIEELGLKINESSYTKIFYYMYRDFVGFNDIDPLINDYFIEDIECNGIDTPVYIVHRLYRNIKTNISFNDIDKLASFVEKIAQRAGRYVSYASPILDGSLPDGSRVNATYTKDISSKGPTFTIRKFTTLPWTPTQLLSFNTLSPEMLAYFWLLIQYRANILLAGGTSSGKTTLLNAISFFIPPESRVVSIEDTRELNLPRENWLPSVARSGVGRETVGEVDLFQLLKSSFRQNPDYVIVGEVRGKEAFVLFQGMASGHPSMSTIHADSVDTVVQRLETPPIELSPTLINTLDVVATMTHAIVNKQQTRRLSAAVEIIHVNPDGMALTNTPFIWNPGDDKFYFKKDSKVFDKIKKRYGLSDQEIQKEFYIRTRLLYEMFKKNVFEFTEVQKIVNEYYKNPQAVLQKFGLNIPTQQIPQSNPNRIAPQNITGNQFSPPRSNQMNQIMQTQKNYQNPNKLQTRNNISGNYKNVGQTI